MDPIIYIDRASGRKEVEKVYGAFALQLLYGNSFTGSVLRYIAARNPFFSSLYGYWQKQPWTRSKIQSFIEAYQIDTSEFLEPIESFCSFNDFFIRKLKPEARPIVDSQAIIPADGRYRVFPRIDHAEGFVVKGERFHLESLLEDAVLAKRYASGSMVMARLSPSDTHRFMFPCACIPEATRCINGWLYSVNPIAIKRDIDIFASNKRTLCVLHTESFGDVIYMEIGATNVGSIHQTYTPGRSYAKGEEKGFFEFGASALILLFEEGRISLNNDLIAATAQGLEMRCLIGQSLGNK